MESMFSCKTLSFLYHLILFWQIVVEDSSVNVLALHNEFITNSSVLSHRRLCAVAFVQLKVIYYFIVAYLLIHLLCCYTFYG